MPAGDLVMIFRHSLGSEVFSSEENCLQQQHQQVSMGHFRLLVIIVNSEELLNKRGFCQDSGNIWRNQRWDILAGTWDT